MTPSTGLTRVRPLPAPGSIRSPLPENGGELRHVQKWALSEIQQHGGALIMVGVGHGKTLIAYGAATVLGLRPDEVLVLLPANLRETFRREGAKYAAMFGTYPVLPVMSYEELSSPDSVRILEDLQPRLIVLDEAHRLVLPSVRTGRFHAYMDAHPDTHLVAMSGTLFSRSVWEIYPIAQYALKERNPLPTQYQKQQSLALAVDPPGRADTFPTRQDWKSAWRTLAIQTPFAQVRPGDRKVVAQDAFHLAMTGTPGVIHTTKSSCDASLYVAPFTVPTVPEVDAALVDLEETWTRPDGEELEDHLRVHAAATQIGLGYFYTWDWPGGEPDLEWNDARLEYARQMRRVLRYNKRKDLDSPALVRAAIERGDLHDPEMLRAAKRWYALEHRAAPTTKPVILTTEIMARVVEYARVASAGRGALIWYNYTAEAEMLQSLGVRVCWPGDEPEYRADLLAVSIASHGTGKQLQDWNCNVVLSPPASGKTWEQLLGRTHRPGQAADEVWCHVLTHTDRAVKSLEKALTSAEFLQRTQGQQQKLHIATKLPVDTALDG